MTGVIILAAGASLRLGRPKQNLLYKGKTLLQHALDAASGVDDGRVVLVTGANETDLLLSPSQNAFIKVYNPEWTEGMGTSVRTGMQCLLSMESDVSSVIMMLCDQPFVNSAFLNLMINEKFQRGKGIVASAYGQTLGAPVLFDKKYFSNLLGLESTEGAKKLLSQFKDQVTSVGFPQGAVDIDTEEDYKALDVE